MEGKWRAPVSDGSGRDRAIAKNAIEELAAAGYSLHDGRLVTPPLDGSILPGVARAGVLDEAVKLGVETREEPLDLEALRASEEVFLTGSLRGVEPVRSLDGTQFELAGPVSTALATALKQRWFGGV